MERAGRAMAIRALNHENSEYLCAFTIWGSSIKSVLTVCNLGGKISNSLKKKRWKIGLGSFNCLQILSTVYKLSFLVYNYVCIMLLLLCHLSLNELVTCAFKLLRWQHSNILRDPAWLKIVEKVGMTGAACMYHNIIRKSRLRYYIIIWESTVRNSLATGKCPYHCKRLRVGACSTRR